MRSACQVVTLAPLPLSSHIMKYLIAAILLLLLVVQKYMMYGAIGSSLRGNICRPSKRRDIMNAESIRYHDDGSIELIEVAVGDPADAEVQVQGGVCGICSWDIATARHGSHMHPMAPPGHEGLGYVVKVGRGVRDLKEGDR